MVQKDNYWAKNGIFSTAKQPRKNRLYPAQNPEAEILKSQIQAIQTEMSRFRTEIGKFKNLEKKVDELDNSVSQIKTSLSNLDKGQENSNYKLDSLIGMIQKLSGQPEAGADMEEDEEDFIPITRKEKSKIPTLTGAGLHDKNLKANLKRLQTGPNSATGTNKNKSC